MKSYLPFILLLSFASSLPDLNPAIDHITKALSHFRLLDRREFESILPRKSGVLLTFVHKGRGAEHVIDIKVSGNENSSINVQFTNAKAEPIEKTFYFSSEIFNKEIELYVELVYRMARIKKSPVYFTSFDDLHVTLKKLMPKHIIKHSFNKENDLVFSILNKDTPVISLVAKLIKVEKGKNVNQDYKISINALYSNNNKVKTFSQTFSVFSKEDFSGLENLLAVRHLESLSEMFDGSKTYFENEKKVKIGVPIILPNKVIAAEIGYIGAKILINLIQEIDTVSQLPKFTVKFGKKNDDEKNLEIKNVVFSESFTRLTQADLDSILKKFDILSLFDSFDKMIIEIYKRVHKETYERTIIGASLKENNKDLKSNNGFMDAIMNFGAVLKITDSKEINQVLETVFKGSVIATFEVINQDMNGVMTFTNQKDNGKFVFELPISMLTVSIVENYLRALLIENVKIAVQKGLI